MSASTIFTIVVIVFVLGGALRGLRRRCGRSLLHALRVGGAVAIAFLLTAQMLKELGDPAYLTKLSDVLAGQAPDVAEKLEQLRQVMPELVTLVVGLPVSFLGPLCFAMLYLVASVILWIPYIILAMILFPRHRRGIPLSRLIGAAVGAVTGLVILAVFLVPTLGYAHTFERAMDALDTSLADNEGYAKLADGYEEYAAPVADHPVSELVYKTVGEKLFDRLTVFSVTYQDESYTLSVPKEVDLYARLFVDIKPLMGAKLEQFDEEQAAAIRALAEDLGESDVLTILVAEVLSEACGAWSRGEDFLGVACPKVENEHGQRLLDAALLIFKDSTPATVCDDLVAMADVISVLAKYEALATFADPDALLELLADGALIDELMAALNSSDNLRHLAEETVKVAVHAACVTLVEDTDYGDATEALAEGAADILNTLVAVPKENWETVLTAELESTLSAYGVEDAPAILPYVSDLLLDEYSEEMASGTVDAAAVLDFLGLVTE